MKLPTAREVLVFTISVLVLAGMWRHTREDAEDTDALRAVLANRDKDLKGAAVSLAAKDAKIAQLTGLVETARILAGRDARVVAGMAILVPRRDTVIVHDTIQTVLLADSTRVARFRDSTFAGIVTAQISAPPCCAALRLDSLHVERPAFRPEVGFIQVGSQYLATVVWQGEHVTVDAAFFQPPQAPKTPRVVSYVEAIYGVTGSHEVRAGSALRLTLPGSGVLGGRYVLGPVGAWRLVYGERPTIGISLRKEF